MGDVKLDLSKSLGFLTTTANRLMSAYFRQQLVKAGIDLTAEQWGVLAFLWEWGNVAQDELANTLCIDKSSLSRAISVLERRGLVTRQRDPNDARRKVLYPTPTSEKFKAPCHAIASLSLHKICAGVSDEEYAICVKVLNQVKSTLRTLSDRLPEGAD